MTEVSFLKIFVFCSILLISCKNEKKSSKITEEKKPLNILMIAVDDLRPTLGAYGDSLVKSPHIDHLASKGILFTNSFCNVPVCGASRASILTGTRPAQNRFLYHNTNSEVDAPHAISLNEHFKNNGYYTLSNGKIFHLLDDRSEGWDENWRPQRNNRSRRGYRLPKNIALEKEGEGPPFEKAAIHDTIYNDGELMLKTIADLKRLKAIGKPFFLASGFSKPHLPFNAPASYWDLYSPHDFTPSLKKLWPENAPKKAFHNSGELRQYHGMPKRGFVSDLTSVTLQHGYYACISYVDALIGKILQTLDELGLRENTIVVLWGDHGWNLGDHGIWNKHCNFDTSLRAPLIISAPEKKTGLKSNAMVEFIDIFPTLSTLCGLETPKTVEGKSLTPLLENPDTEWTDFIISKFKDGVTLRTSQYAYTEWRTDKDSLISNMLYDHIHDKKETNNIANHSTYKRVVDSLQKKLLKNRGKDYFTSIKELKTY